MSESWMRRDLKRFGVEFLCLLVLLSGDPLQAISEAGAARARLEVTAEAPTRDALERETTFEYDDAGRQTRTNYPDSTFEERTYDLEGRLLTVRNRAGKVTSFEYDPVGRLKKTIFPGGAFTESVYDDAGRLVTSIDARGQATTYGYDKAGRRTTVTDALEHVTIFRHDAAGHPVEGEDPLQRITGFEYDDAGRLVKTLLPDGSSTTTEYDALGRRVAEVDQALVRTEFSYGALGRLVQVRDALEGVTTYGYDELGNRLSQTDANQHATRFEYDAVDRQTKRILPDGSFESFTYDAAGNRRTRTDFNGVTATYEYDVNGRLSRRSYPDGSAATFTYTPTGRRSTVIDVRGVTSYFYDDRDRLLEMVYPDGRRLEYGYDAAGNRTSLTAHVAGQVLTTGSTYDALNRLDVVTDPDGRAYDHGYDANGNRASLAYPNGVVTSYVYNPLNRLTDLSTTTSVGDVVQSYAYTLGPAGNRTRVEEHDGTVRGYGYDDLYRLTTESVSDVSGTIYAKTFTYDPVGNRLSQATTGAGAGTVDYAYDERDRLVDKGGQVYGWDANGNLVTKAAEATYGWNLEDRLESVVLADGTLVAHTYDVDGVRVRTETTPPGGATEVVDYLVDTRGVLSQVVAETDGVGSLNASYVRRDDLLAVIRPVTGVRFYHADGLGSIRALTDDTEAVTDRWSFTAFGELIKHVGSDENAYLFAGEPLDPNAGFYYNRARWMDPMVGRFSSLDSFAGVLMEPFTLHRYLYVRADPVNRSDPTGLSDLTVGGLVAAMAIGATVFVASTYLITGSVHRAAHSAVTGALIGATFYAAIPYAVTALWEVSLLGGGVTSTVAGSGAGTVTLYRAMSVAEYRQLVATGRFAPGTTSSYENGKWFAEQLSHAVKWGEIFARLSGNARWVVVEVRLLAPAANRFIRLERLDGIGPARYAEVQQINRALQGVTLVHP